MLFLHKADFKIILFGAVISLFTISYLTFTFYKPIINFKTDTFAVKGSKTQSDLIYPQGAVEISRDEVSGTGRITFKIDRSIREIYLFYKSTLPSKNWVLKTQKIDENRLKMEFTKEGRNINISASTDVDSNSTIFSMELSS